MASRVDSAEKYNFVSELDTALQCVVCLEVAEEPWQHGKCGRLFCRQCLEELGRDNPCPNCRTIQPQYFEDNKSKRDINALPVKCGNKNCKWKGTVSTLSKHESICWFSQVPCPNRCGSLMRKNLKKHLSNECPNREYCCLDCGVKDTYIAITQVHDKVCEEKMVSCSNLECYQTMERRLLKEHVRTKCAYTVIECKYKNIGCTKELQRRDMAVHEYDDTLHLHMALDTVSSLQNTLESLTLKNDEPMTFALLDYHEKRKTKEIFTSPSFYMGRYHMSVRVYANGNGDGEGTHLSVFISVLEGKHDARLKWPFTGTRTIYLLNQLEDRNHHALTMADTEVEDPTASCGSTLGFPKFIPHTALPHNPKRNTRYLKDNTLYFRVLVKPDDNKPWLECTSSSHC